MIYDGGNVYNASSPFIQNPASRYCSLTSEAFPTYEIYLSKAITTEDVLEWQTCAFHRLDNEGDRIDRLGKLLLSVRLQADAQTMAKLYPISRVAKTFR